jgi:hypothetical protein
LNEESRKIGKRARRDLTLEAVLKMVETGLRNGLANEGWMVEPMKGLKISP